LTGRRSAWQLGGGSSPTPAPNLEPPPMCSQVEGSTFVDARRCLRILPVFTACVDDQTRSLPSVCGATTCPWVSNTHAHALALHYPRNCFIALINAAAGVASRVRHCRFVHSALCSDKLVHPVRVISRVNGKRQNLAHNDKANRILGTLMLVAARQAATGSSRGTALRLTLV